MFDEDNAAVLDQPGTETVEAAAGEPFSSLTPETDFEDASQPAQGQVQEENTAETYQLPDEQSKVFPDDIIQEYAQKRYPNLVPLLADPKMRDHVQQILHDKLNTDIYVEQLRKDGEQKTEEEETEQEPVQAQTLPTPTQEQLTKEIGTFVDRVTDPAIAQTYFKSLNEAVELASGPKGDGGVAFMKVLSAGAVNLMRDAIPALLPASAIEAIIGDYMSKNYEGLDVSHVENSRVSAWESIRASDPKYANLPAYGTPEWTAAHVNAAKMVPGIENAVFTDGRGNILPASQQFTAKAQLAAKLIAGTATAQNVQAATAAVETGKQLARESQQRKANGNLGAGQTRGKITQTVQPQGIDAARKQAIARLRNDEDPFASLRAKE